MDWICKLQEELHQAKQEEEGLLQWITLEENEVRICQQQSKIQLEEYDAKIQALKKEKDNIVMARNAIKAEMRIKMVKLKGSQQELSVVKRKIEFTKELQKYQNRMDLQKFPRKVLEIILEFLLVEDTPICIPREWECKRKDNLAVFYTCKKIRTKACRIFFGRNNFQICSDTSLIARNFTWLQHIRLQVEHSTPISRLLLEIESCVQLQSLLIEICGVPSCQETLCSLEFKKPPSLRKISVECNSMETDICNAYEILNDVVLNGCYVSPEEGPRKKRQRVS